MKIDIIGAGIGGLTTALALEQKGYQPTIYEQAEIMKQVGAGIILASNAMQVYRHLGLEKELISNGLPMDAMKVRDADLKVISSINMDYFKEKYDLQSLSIHRGALQQVLLNNLKHTTIHLDHKLDRIEKTQKGYSLTFENETSIVSDLLIGADGVHSKVRDVIVPNTELRTVNQVCWRGVVDYELPAVYRNEVNEVWGRGGRFGFVEISKGRVYWFALQSFKKHADEFSIEQLSSYFPEFPSIVRDIIDSTPVPSIHTSIMGDLKPISTWHDDHACLIGDAAHATTPNMGQGACQSIEDAYVITNCLAEYDVPQAFAEYQKSRMSNAHLVVNQSWTLGKVAHWRNPIAISLRNTILRMVPEKMNQMMLDKLFKLEIS